MMKKFFGLVLLICLLVAGAAYLFSQYILSRSSDSARATPSSLTRSNIQTAPSPPPLAPLTITAPTTDTIPPNPPNGMVFSGSGPFQLYRQGNLTWRVDTGSGKSCILFATDTEWRKPRVYQQGCATS